MRVAINTRFLLPHKMEGFGWYTYEVSKRLVEMYPQHEFIFFFDRKFENKFVFGKNVTPVVVNPPARHPILFKIWFDLSIKRALKKYKADVFFSPDGYLSLTSSVKQIGVIHDINFEHNPQDLPKTMLNYLTTFFPRFAQKASHIITVSEYSKQDIISTYGIEPSKITAIWNGASDAFKPLTDLEKTAVKQTYTKGEDYLLFVGALHPRKNLIRLLEAFTRFRAITPESTTKLVIVGEAMWDNENFKQVINPEIRSEIVFTGHLSLEELTRIMGGAKALTFVPYFEGFGIPLAEAMRCGTPILSGDRTSLPEVAGEAALYCNPFDVEDITRKLVELDQNEKLRAELSVKGLERSELFNWDICAQHVAKVLGL